MVTKTTTQAIYNALLDSGIDGISFTDAQKIAYNRAHPDRKYTRENRGFWCGNLCGAHSSYIPNTSTRKGLFERWGCKKLSNGKYILPQFNY